MHKLFYFILSCTLVFAASPELETHYKKGVALSIEEKYDQALALFDSLELEYPNEPGIYFFKASIWQSKMEDYFTRRWENQFSENFAKAVNTANQRIKANPNDLDARFFLGAALSYNSYEQVEDKNYLAGFRQAKEAIKEFQYIHKNDPENCDVLLGLGMFMYFKSDATKMVSWLPFIKDERKKGLAMLHKAADCGKFLNWAALNNLIWLHIQRKEFDKAIELSKSGLQRFPNKRFFLWPYARALYKNKQYQAAIDVYIQLLQSMQSENINNHYHEARARLQIAKALRHLGKPKEALLQLNLVLSTIPDPEIAEKYAGKKREAVKITSEINNAKEKSEEP